MKTLSYLTEDSNGVFPNPDLIGLRLMHLDNKKEYILTGFCWMEATVEWGFIYAEFPEIRVSLVRPLSHLFGFQKNGERRYKITAPKIALVRT